MFKMCTKTKGGKSVFKIVLELVYFLSGETRDIFFLSRRQEDDFSL